MCTWNWDTFSPIIRLLCGRICRDFKLSLLLTHFFCLLNSRKAIDVRFANYNYSFTTKPLSNVTVDEIPMRFTVSSSRRRPSVFWDIFGDNFRCTTHPCANAANFANLLSVIPPLSFSPACFRLLLCPSCTLFCSFRAFILVFLEL